MNEGLANGVGDFNVFSALGDVNFQDLSSEIDDDATELNLVEAVTSGEKLIRHLPKKMKQKQQKNVWTLKDNRKFAKM